MIILDSGRLQVEISEPQEIEGVRFDRTAFVRQVTLDGTYHFCEDEPKDLEMPWTGGSGLSSEIRSEAVMSAAKPGERFHKFGVGRFVKPDENPYLHYYSYECEPYEIQYDYDSATASFVIEPVDCGGFSLREEKKVTVNDNTLCIEYKVKNTGDKPFDIDEYSHNFVSIEGNPSGPDYTLEMKVTDEDVEKVNGKLHYKNGILKMTDYVDDAAMLMVEEMTEDFSWKLSHKNSPVSVREVDSFRPSICGIWIYKQIISPEVHFQKVLLPGEECFWKRTWYFETNM